MAGHGHAVSDKLLHLVHDDEPAWGEGEGQEFTYDEEEEEEARSPNHAQLSLLVRRLLPNRLTECAQATCRSWRWTRLML